MRAARACTSAIDKLPLAPKPTTQPGPGKTPDQTDTQPLFVSNT
jgi:hypothetical protein